MTDNLIMNTARIALGITTVFLATPIASAQVGKPVAEVELEMGNPIKDYSYKTPPTKIYLSDDIQIQATYSKGVVDAAVYSVAAVSAAGREPISETQVKKILALNGLSESDLVPLNFDEYPQLNGLDKKLNGLYKKSKDSKILFLHDTQKHLISITDFNSLIAYLRSMR